MPTFFEGLSRLLKGEKVFKPGEDMDGFEYPEDKIQDENQPQVQQPADYGRPQMTTASSEATVQRTGPKIRPEVTIVKVENRINGQYLDVSITIQNNSQVTVEVEELWIIGVERHINFTLPPGKAQEFVSVYNGARLTHRNYTNCEVRYRDETGDYFSAIHNVEFKQEADGTYTLNRIRFIPPVKDI